jgi:hypothetical protein
MSGVSDWGWGAGRSDSDAPKEEAKVEPPKEPVDTRPYKCYICGDGFDQHETTCVPLCERSPRCVAHNDCYRIHVKTMVPK